MSSDKTLFFSDGAEHYFAAANSHIGFKSFFDSIFNPCDFEKIYILKGGPGVGKSTLMKKAASLSIKEGICPICYHCSSDTSSLDAVILPDKKIAVIDGTSPHTIDPTAAGVKEVIINMGQCWQLDTLKQHTSDILTLNAKKSSLYRASYKYLAAAKQIKDCLWEITDQSLLQEKLLNDVYRKCRRTFKTKTAEKPNRCVNVLTSANSCGGRVRLCSFEEKCKNICFLKDLRFIAELYLDTLYSEAKKQNVSVIASISPDEPCRIDGLYFPEYSACFTLYNEEICRALDKKGIVYSVTNMRRFCDSDVFRQNRAYYRFGEKCRSDMYDNALLLLSKAGKMHLSIEELYSKATDYNKVSQMSDKVLSDIFN